MTFHIICPQEAKIEATEDATTLPLEQPKSRTLAARTLGSVWRDRNSHPPVGTQHGTDTVGDRLAVSYKTKDVLTIWFNSHPKPPETDIYTKPCTQTFRAACSRLPSPGKTSFSEGVMHPEDGILFCTKKIGATKP